MNLEHLQQKKAAISGIILAAGTSTRMGRDKLSLPFRGKPIVQHVIDAARNSILETVTIVLPEQSDLEPLLDLDNCKIIYSTERAKGQAESLKAGISSAKSHAQGAMVLLGDLPLISPEVINHLIWAFSQEPHNWVIPMQEGMRGNPITIPSQWFDKVMELEGDTGARPLLATPRLPLRLVKVNEIGPFIDVDTEQQYQMLLNRYDTAI
ncbi:nucleotidyltransferase family protein [Halodesulfovibrio marinisediminis]|uniref:Molybdenum cofactor cytidylyltransferase n=1 Tax=Halodesulfovibrio marinisediminis DSM 17456 TaxID=1121457 RepID=A0A1N6IAE8_9BACT|nr:nucleotidyltransferase family protein [Halodesulfovibrio marinisediminis]SIO28982.1 molybdenum cofactor cytidylyltransferase [Halodesulfovibrio marinisediminis DSM 17456]